MEYPGEETGTEARVVGKIVKSRMKLAWSDRKTRDYRKELTQINGEVAGSDEDHS